ncbi:MAG TPA: response regulator transcription factor [Thermomicrobiales bacterium]|jgi:DNA-binding response OmpR family regulator|nr:response regulator transcription factor [Thermomicrobiales bacterium]
MASILIVEDERDLNDLIARQLRQEGHEVRQAGDGQSGLTTALGGTFDLVILDWMLPRLDGLTVARRIREQSVVPILMLTARGEETDIVLGLEVGADDYLTKPFRMRELTARVRALLRRVALGGEAVAGDGGTETPAETITINDGLLSISEAMRTVTLRSVELDLTPKEFELIVLFARNPGRAFSREYLLERIWGDDTFVTDRTVDTHVQRLRKKLGDEAELIRTVWGIGYKFQPPRE